MKLLIIAALLSSGCAAGPYPYQPQPVSVYNPVPPPQSPYQVYGPLPQFNQPYDFNRGYTYHPIPVTRY